MFSPMRRKKRPLGHYVPESRVELLVEKALFRTNAQILRDMCDKKTRQKQQERQLLDVNNFNPFKLEQTRMEHIQATDRAPTYSNISPEVRWLLTRSARLQRANNAGFSKYRNPVKDRVVSASGKRGKNIQSLERQRSMCNRITSYETSETRKLQCDVLGPSFCTDCTRIQEEKDALTEQRRNFPRLEVHTRSLVAPEKVEKLYLSHPKQLFHPKTHYSCGCKVDPTLEITTPLVYTPHEIFERIRRKKNIEKGNELIRKEQAFRREHNNTPEGQVESRPTFYEEKTEPPLDMKVSVTFRPDY